VRRSGPLKELSFSGEFRVIQAAVELVLQKLESEGSEFQSMGHPPVGRQQLEMGSFGMGQMRPLSMANSKMGLLMGPLLGQQPSMNQEHIQHRGQLITGQRMNFWGGDQTGSNFQSAFDLPSPLQQTYTSSQMASSSSSMVHPLSATAEPMKREAFPSLMVSIPKDQVGAYIGKSGVQVRDLERVSGARISIESSKGTDDTASTVTFQGTVEENILAYKLTVQKLEELARIDQQRTSGSDQW